MGARYDDPRFDPPNCYGFVRYCYALAGIELPRDIRRNRRNITMVWPVSGAKNFLPVRANDYSPLPSPQYMDALYFRSSILQPRHIALALNQIWMIQSSEATNGVAIVRLDRPGIGNNLVAVYRHVGANNYSPLPPLRS